MNMEFQDTLDFFNPTTQKTAQENGCTVYQMSNDTGKGVITHYQVFPGIELFYNNFHMKNGYNENKLPKPDVMEINHCRMGRFECELSNGDCIYLGEGDLSISMLTNTTRETRFPLSQYHGISMTFYLPQAARSLAAVGAAFGGMPIDLFQIRDKMCQSDTCLVMRTKDTIQHIFSELYKTPTDLMPYYFKIKVLELLFFLHSANPSEYKRERRYFYKNQVQTIKEIHAYLVENLGQHLTLDELSQQFSIPMTSMKTCFKAVYGSSIYAYIKSYRIQAAAALLRESGTSITEIASQMGYDNPSKFSEAFKKEIGILPSEYRNCPSE